MRKEDAEALQSLPLFSGMTDAMLERILHPSFVQAFPPHMILLRENEPTDFLFVILDGLVLMSARSAGSETALEILHANDIFILAAVLNDGVCLQTAQTLAPTRVLMVPSTLVRELISEDAGFMRAVVFEIARAYRRLVKELKAQKLRSSTQRLANWIVRESLANNNTDIVTIPYEKRILAAYLGMTPENLSRSFANLAPHGVTVRASMIRITDRKKLMAFAAPSHLIDNAEPLRRTMS